MSSNNVDEKGNLLPRPSYHPQIASLIEAMKPSNNLTLAGLTGLRAQTSPTAEAAIGERPIHHVSTHISNVEVSVFTKKEEGGLSRDEKNKPCVLHIHGGGTVAGNRFLAISEMLDWVVEMGLVCVSVEYRLAPESPFPAGLEDCAAVLRGIQKNAAQYGIDEEKVILVAGSGGAVLTAGLALKVRDEMKGQREGGPGLKGMLLCSPSLHHRLNTSSAHQFVDGGISDQKSSESFWGWYLGGEKQDYNIDNVAIYASPGLADDLSGLPPTYIDAGSAEMYRDGAVEFASKIWRGGGNCELHVWPGGCHIFSVLCPQLEISKEAIAARRIWLMRCLGIGGLV